MDDEKPQEVDKSKMDKFIKNDREKSRNEKRKRKMNAKNKSGKQDTNKPIID